MEISDVRVKLMDNATDRLKAVCSVTFDEEFVVRDLKVVDGTNGLFVAMPSRKLAVHCPQCRHKNHLRARFCNDCGAKLPPNRVSADANGRVRLHRDIAHPINPAFRELIQTKLIERYTAERELAGQPGYQPTDLDAELDDIADTSVAQDAQDVPVVASEISEYDALIASLRSGTSDPPPAARVQPPTLHSPKPEPAAKGSDDEPQRRPSRPANAGRGERSPSAPPREPNRRPAPAPVTQSDWRPPVNDDLDDAAPVAPGREMISIDAVPAPTKPIVERQPAKPAPSLPTRSVPLPAASPTAKATGHPGDTDDDAPFGAGIL